MSYKHIKKISDLEIIIERDENKPTKLALYVANTFAGLGRVPVQDAELFAKNLPEYQVSLMIDPSSKLVLNTLREMIEIPNAHVLFAVFSHGTQVKDTNFGSPNAHQYLDEKDGYDEAIVMKDGLIIDDTITEMINKYRKCKKLTLIADICHSTIFDYKDYKNKDNLTILTACADHQTSKQLSKNGVFTMQFWNCYNKQTGILNVNELGRRLSLFDQTPQIYPFTSQIIF